MGFTTQIFTFFFLPICLMGWFGVLWAERWGRFGALLKRWRIRDVVLMVFGLGFYGWSCLDDLGRVGVYICLVYLLGRMTAGARKQGQLAVQADAGEKRISLAGLAAAGSAAVLVFVLVYSKYWNTVLDAWNWFFDSDVPHRSIRALLGISFLSFSAISYVVDCSRGESPGSLFDCALYLTFFPKVISGPTVLWKDFCRQIPERKIDLGRISAGIDRIMIGFAKKLILADTFGAALAEIPKTGIDTPTAWIGAGVYMLQIYYDFAGYSDIAIGLSGLFGFAVKNNFNFPYRSKSVGEFWRRWHISLGSWFREYVYFPLGGSRVGLKRNLWNLFIVFVLTGLWHGNGWMYLIWGVMNGVLVVLERVVRDRPGYRKTPDWIKWAFTMGFTLICWEFFRFASFSDLRQWFAIAFGLQETGPVYYTWAYYLDARLTALCAIGALGAIVPDLGPVRRWYGRAAETKLGYGLRQVVLLVLFGIALMCMVSSTYSPFIYFQY